MKNINVRHRERQGKGSTQLTDEHKRNKIMSDEKWKGK
jgi:hypothetical protein